MKAIKYLYIIVLATIILLGEKIAEFKDVDIYEYNI